MTPRTLRLAILVMAAIFLWTAYLCAWFVGFSEDPVWYLEIARNFARGNGLSMRILVPAQIASLPPNFDFPTKLSIHGPLACLVIGLAYKIFGIYDWVPLAYSFGTTLVVGLLIYRLAHRLGGEKVALSATAFWYSSYIVMEANYSALTDPLFILFITLAVSCLWESTDNHGPIPWIFASGFLVGLGSATRLAGQTYWLSFILATIWLHRRFKTTALFITGLLIPVLLLGLYHKAAAGVFFYSPGFYILNWSPSFPGFRSSTSYMGINSLEALMAYPLDFLQKSITGPAYAANRFLESAFNPYLMACIFFGLCSNFGAKTRAQKFRNLSLWIGSPVFVINAVLSYGGMRYLNPLLPMFVIIASLFLWRFVSENGINWRRQPLLWTAAAALLFLSPAALQIKDHGKTRKERSALYAEQNQLGEFIKLHTKVKEVIYTDNNRLVVWQGDRPAVSLTATQADAEKTFKHLPPDAILLTSIRIDSPDYDPIWRHAFYQRKPVMGFVPCQDFASDRIKAILFRHPKQCHEL